MKDREERYATPVGVLCTRPIAPARGCPPECRCSVRLVFRRRQVRRAKKSGRCNTPPRRGSYMYFLIPARGCPPACRCSERSITRVSQFVIEKAGETIAPPQELYLAFLIGRSLGAPRPSHKKTGGAKKLPPPVSCEVLPSISPGASASRSPARRSCSRNRPEECRSWRGRFACCRCR